MIEMEQSCGARVEHMLDEIARLSREEQAELIRDLPRVLHSEHNGRTSVGTRGGPPLEAVQHAVELRERIRRRLATASQSPSSINSDLDDVRNDRLDDLLDSSADMLQDTGDMRDKG